MYKDYVNVLLIEDDHDDRKLIQIALSRKINPQFKLSIASDLSEGRKVLSKKEIDIVLLDLFLPDCQDFNDSISFHSEFSHIPFILLTGLNDRDMGLKALDVGFQDYMVKGQFDEDLLTKSIIYAIERKAITSQLKNEERTIRLFVKYSPIAMAVFDKNMRYIITSQRWLDDYGMTEEQVVGNLHYDVLVGISEKWKKYHKDCLEGNSAKSDEDLIVFPDGRKEYIRWEMHPWKRGGGEIGGMIIVREVITERKLVEKQLDEHREHLEDLVNKRTESLDATNEKLHQLNANLQDVREKERAGIAREIHDDLGQALTALKIDSNWLKKKADSSQDDVCDKINGMIELIDSSIKTVQRISSELRPGILDDLGLTAAIEWQVSQFQKRQNMACILDCDEVEIEDKRYTTALFRIFQESLTNISRHAEASEAHISLKNSHGSVTLKISDNGKGISDEELARADSFGLMGMKERVEFLSGSITIQGSHNKGTLVEVIMPLTSQPLELEHD